MSHATRSRCLLTTIASLAVGGVGFAQSTYVIAGPAESLSPSSGVLGWEGAEMAAYRRSVEDPAHFGEAGLSPIAVQTRTLSSVDDVSLAGVDAFVCSYWNDAEITPAQSDALLKFFLEGGDLVVITDDADHDALADRLGLRVLPGFNETSAETAPPLGTGDFGRVADADVPLSAPGYLDARRIRSKGGHLGAITPFDLAAAAWWSRGDFGPHTGALVVLADPGLVTDGDYAGFDDLAKFALNMTEFLSKRTRVKVLGGPSAALQPSSSLRRWETGADIGDVKAALSDVDNFGRLAPAAFEIRLHFYDSIRTANLGLCDSFIVPFWKDADLSATQRSAIVNAHGSGMDLIVWLNRPDEASILADLQLGFGAGTSTTMHPLAPLDQGPFGEVSSVSGRDGLVTLVRGDIEDRPGYVAAEDGDGEAIAAYFLEKDRSGSTANLVVVTDGSFLSDTDADFDGLDDEARFALNTFHRVLNDRKIRVAGPSSNLNPGSRGWAGSAMVDFREALRDPGHFGPQGLHPRGIDVLDMAVLDELTLATLDVFVPGQWDDDAMTSADVARIVQFVERGGCVLLTPETEDSDRLSRAFGLVTDEDETQTTTGVAPCYEGPFGSASVVPQSLGAVHFEESPLLAQGGRVIGRNADGEVAVALLPRSALSVDSGAVLSVGDVHQFTSPNYDVLLVDSIFALNSIAALAALPPDRPVAEPYGHGHAGTGGIVPTLRVEGSFVGGSWARLRVANGVGRGRVLLLLGTSGRSELPFNGVDLLVNGPWTRIVFNLAGSPGAAGEGIADLVARVPPGLDTLPLGIQMQALVFDPGAFGGIAATDAVEVLLD